MREERSKGRNDLETKSQGRKNEEELGGSGGMRKLGEREPKGYKEKGSQQRCQETGRGGGAQPFSSLPRGMSPANPSLCRSRGKGPRDDSLAGVEALSDNAPRQSMRIQP